MKVVKVEHKEKYLSFRCEGCKCNHQIPVKRTDVYPMWEWNGSYEKPTITPSILVNYDFSHPGRPKCHSFITDGNIQFLNDCTHELAGKTVPLTKI